MKGTIRALIQTGRLPPQRASTSCTHPAVYSCSHHLQICWTLTAAGSSIAYTEEYSILYPNSIHGCYVITPSPQQGNESTASFLTGTHRARGQAQVQAGKQHPKHASSGEQKGVIASFDKIHTAHKLPNNKAARESAKHDGFQAHYVDPSLHNPIAFLMP